MEAILLAGGLGTRLHKVTGDTYPKSLAEVDGKPFLHYIIKYLESMGVKRFIFAVSHHAQMIVDNVNESFPNLDCVFSYENEPMGTGGAIKQALEFAQSDDVLVVNSDSFMEFSLDQFCLFHQKNQASLSIICTQVDDINRFGAADINDKNCLNKFFEKGGKGGGYINSGIYLINIQHPTLLELSGRFSFETEILASKSLPVYAMKNTGLFFDIGTPDDFVGAQKLVANHSQLFIKK
jgi:D-glycero-alpha-D-manno-heptose 1-phosphate guanylyltransferase